MSKRVNSRISDNVQRGCSLTEIVNKLQKARNLALSENVKCMGK